MCKKVFYSDATSYVFISANTEEQCRKRANHYFNSKGVDIYHNVFSLWN